MAEVRELDLKLLSWEVRYILESLEREMARLKKINSESEDEDEVADAGNDYMEIASIYESLSAKASDKFDNF